jgi:hypothetical protein
MSLKYCIGKVGHVATHRIAGSYLNNPSGQLYTHKLFIGFPYWEEEHII